MDPLYPQKGQTVKIHYKGTYTDGEIFDESAEPFEFTIGNGEVIAGFEEAVVQMQVNETKTVSILPEMAYGPRFEELVMSLEKNQFPAESTPEIGMNLQLQQPDGETLMAVITDIDESYIWIDANHPLAGETLVFELHLLAINV